VITEKIKVVHFIANLTGGGAQTQLLMLCNGLNKLKFDVFIVCWDDTLDSELHPDVSIIKIPRGNKYNILVFAKRIISVCRVLNPPIIHLWLPELITLPASFYGLKTKSFVISSERRLPSTNPFKIVFYRDRIEYLIHLFSDVVVTNFPTPIKRKSIFNYILSIRGGVTIFNGVKFSEPINESTNKNTSDFRIIYCGRFVSQKNVVILLEALVMLINEGHSNINLDLYGNGELESELKSFVTQYKIENHVSFKGYDENWKKHSVTADCFVLPTSREGMPNVLFEAASIGLPIISTTIEEIAYHFTDGYDALLSDPKDVESLKSNILKIKQNKKMADDISLNALRTIEQYSVQNMVNTYENLYIKGLKNNYE
tara:strand:- start:8176 stop:9288 length:1113 start_codon:yes stop_codon:yes gene_type:complete